MKFKALLKASTAAITVGALLLTGTAVSTATPVASAAATREANLFRSPSQLTENEFSQLLATNEEAAGLYQALSYFDSIPDAVLAQGDSALKQWRDQNPIYVSRASVWGCIGAIAWIIGSNVVGVAKILKIKKYIKALGGVKEAVQLMWGASFKIEKMKAAGGALAGLGAELLGITEVKDQCFS